MDFGKYNKEKVFRYSIRKYHFGAASVAVAALMFFANGAVAAHEPITPATANEVATVGSDGKADGDLGSSDEGDSNKVLTDQPAELTAADEVKTQEAPAEETNQGQAGAESNSAQSETNPANQEPSQAGEVKEQEQPTVADTTAAKSTQGNLQALLAKLTLSSMQELHAEVEARLAAAKAVLEDPKATQAQVDEQARAMEALIRRVNQALEPSQPKLIDLGEADSANNKLVASEGSVTERASRGKRRKREEVIEPESVANQVSPTDAGKETAPEASSQTNPKRRGKRTESVEQPATEAKETPKQLSTYTNGSGTYALKDEMDKIVAYLRKNGGDETKVALIKANSDKLNEKLGLADEDGVISEEDFNKALQDLDYARATIEGFLEDKENGGKTEIPKPEAILNRQERSVANNGSTSYDNSKVNYFEDGKHGASPYLKYTYVYYNRVQRGVAVDNVDRSVSEGKGYIYADVTPTKTGFRWDLYINQGNHQLAGSGFWFTVPKDQRYKANTATAERISPGKTSGTAESPNSDTILDMLKLDYLGFDNETQGNNNQTGITRKGRMLTELMEVGSLDRLARQVKGSALYNRSKETSAERTLADNKFNIINGKDSNLYYFEMPDTKDSYHLSFETTGNYHRIGDLAYAVGSKGTKQEDGLTTIYLVNQWSAKTPAESQEIDKYPFSIKGSGDFLVDQDRIYSTAFSGYGASLGGNLYSGGDIVNKPFDPRANGVISYGGNSSNPDQQRKIDFYSYLEYKDGAETTEKGKKDVILNGVDQTFTFYRENGTEISGIDLSKEVASTPGKHSYFYIRRMGDGSSDKGSFRFITKPKTPNFTGDVGFVGESRALTASNGTNGIPMTLYLQVPGEAKAREIDTQVANTRGEVTFKTTTIEKGTYFVRSVVPTGGHVDYSGNKHQTVDSEKSTEKQAIVAPKVKVGNIELLPTSTAANAQVLYTVVQGERFRPRIEVWDDAGKLNKFTISNLPSGVTANANFTPQNNATERNTFDAVFNGSVQENQAVGSYTAKITVADESNKEKDYYFKYEVVTRDTEAPTVTMNGKALTETATDNRFAIYRGAAFNPTFVVNDNSGTTTYLKVNDTPNGVWFNKQGSSDLAKEGTMRNGSAEATYQISHDNVVEASAPLGTHEANVVVRDARGNEKTYKFQYTVVDVQAKNTPKDVAVNSTLGEPQDYLKVVDNSSGTEASKYLPDKVTYTWKEGTTTKANNTKLDTVGTVTKYKATVNIPNSTTPVKKTIDGNEYTIYAPTSVEKAITFNVQDTVAPTVKLTNKANNNTEVTLTNNPSVTTIDVYRGAIVELPFKYYDNANTGKVNISYVSGLPTGVKFNESETATSDATINQNGKTESTPGTYTVRGRVATDAPLGVQTVTLKVSDAANGNVDQGNKKEVKFNIRVLDIDFEGRYSSTTGATKIVKELRLNEQTSDPNEYLTAITGTDRRDGLFPQGMTFRYITGANNNEFKTNLTFTAPGKYLVKAGAFYPTTYVPTNGLSTTPANATGDRLDEIRNRTYTTRDIEFHVKPTAPTVTAEANGDVVVAHSNQPNVNTLSFTYTDKDNRQQTVTATKTGNTWALNNAPADGVTINATSGTVTIKDRQVRDATEVTAKVEAQGIESIGTPATSLAGEKTPPTFTFSNKYTEVVSGERVVYVTPTEDLAGGSITLGTVNDNSGKLREVVLYHGNGRDTHMEFGLNYNKKSSENNVEFNAPYDIEITGKLPKINSNTGRIWNNNDSVVTRYVYAKDAADNELKDVSDNNQNPTRVKIKVLTQAAKYEPTINAQTLKKDLTVSGVSVTEAEFNKMKSNLTFSTNRGDVKVAYNSPDMNITMKENGAIKSEGGSYYVGATITYPDGSTKDIRIPVETADKVAPTVKLTNRTDADRVVTLNANESTSPVVTVYRGANLNLPLTFFDNDSDGRVNLKYVSGLPNGIQFNGTSDTLTETGKTQDSVGTHTITGRIPANAQLGLRTVTLKVSDGSNGVDSGNKTEVKFRLKVVDLDFESSRSKQANQPSITVPATAGQSLEDANNYLTVNDGTNRQDNGNFPSGMTFRMVNEAGEVITKLPEAPGRYVVKARAYFPVGYAGTEGIGTVVTGNADNQLNGRRYIEKTINFEVKPTAPVVTPQDNGDVIITHGNETNVNRLRVTYTTQATNPQEVTYTASKNGDTWSFGSGTPITIDGATGTVKIKDRSVKDGSTVKVKAFMTTNGNLESSEATGVAKDGDHVFPTVEFQNTEEDADGNRVVYITPTEETNLPVATFNDNSNKLSQVGFVEYNGNFADLGDVGIDYDRYPTNGDTIYEAPKTAIVTGTLNKLQKNGRVWANEDVIITRYASAIDAAGNDLHTVPGNKLNDKASPTRVLFKVRTQATKYTPTITVQHLGKDIALDNATVTQEEFEAMKQNLKFTTTKGDVKVAYNTANMMISMNNGGAITRDSTNNSYKIGATITYPDGSSETIDIPITAPSQRDIYTPTAVEKTVEKDSQPEARDSISNASSLPENTRIEWKAGTLNTSAPGVKQATITVAYPDGTSEDVEHVTVNVKPSQPAVTPAGNGDVTITPVDKPNVNTLKVTYTPADNNQLQDNGDVTKTPQAVAEIVATKGTNNQWTITTGQKDGISIDPSTGEITLKDEVVKGQAAVTAKVAAQGVESDDSVAQVATGDQTNPVIGASSKIVGVGTNVNIPLDLSDGTGVGIDEGNIKVTGLPTSLSYDKATKSITGTLDSVSKNEIKVTVLDKNGNKAEKMITITAVKLKPIFAIKDATIENVDNAANFVEIPEGVTLTSASWKDGDKPTTATVGSTNKTVEVNLDGERTELTIPVTVYPTVTLRKVNNKEVATYYEIVGKALTSALWGTRGRTQPPTADFYVAFEGDRPAGTTVEFENGVPLSIVAGEMAHKIIVTYPNGTGTVVKTVTFKTYNYEPNYPTGKEYFETEVGKAFKNTNVNSYVKPSTNLSTPSRVFIGWGNHGYGASPVDKAQTTIGLREENVNVHYGNSILGLRGDDSNLYSEQDIKVALAVKPKAPTLQGQAGTRPAVTVSNLPEASELASGAIVKVQLKDAQGNVVAEKEVTAGEATVTFAAADYKKDLTLGEQLNANVLVSGTYKKTEGSTQVDTDYEVSSTNSDSVTVKNYADFYRDQVTYPTNAEKVTYGNSDIANGNFIDAAKERFVAKIQEVNANNNNLPADVTYTKGTTDDKAKVATINFPEDGSTIDISHTQVAKPTAPTFNATVGSGEDAKLSDVDRTISGTALESATKVVLTLQTGRTVEIDANNGKDPANLQPGEGALKNGVWTYKLPDNTYLRQTDQTAEIGSSDQPVKVKQTVFTAESDESKIYVAKERSFAGKTITAAKGSQTLTDLKTDARKGIKYTEKDVEKDFPSDFTATWKETPDVETVGTRKYKVQLTETSATGTNKVGEYDVTITVTNPAPAALTYENKQNGETVVTIPEDADEVVFTVPTTDTNVNTITVSKANGWTADGIEKRGNTWVFPANSVQGNRQVTAVATAGSGDTKSAQTPTSISAPAHTVTTKTITKVIGENPTNAELLAAVDVANKQSAALKEGTQYPTTVGSHTLDVVVTYADQSTEKVTVPYVVKPADKTALTQANNALGSEITSAPDTADKPASKVTAYDDAKKAAEAAKTAAQEVINNDNATPEAVQAEITKVNAAKDALKKVEDAVTAAATTT
ncbi:Rib/alpha-like domain-containing protein, partial [Streptococcus sp. 428]